MDEIIKDKLLKAGKIAAQVRREGAEKLAVPGTSFLEVMDYCEKKIIELGCQIAWVQMAINEQAAHFCPTDDETAVSEKGQLIKIDIGVHLDGYIADNAMTVEVGDSDKYTEMIETSKNALRSAIALVKPGVEIWQLGEAQLKEAQAKGFTTVRNLCGHTLGQYKVHAGVSIPTYNNKDKTKLQEGWHIAIEPFVTNGEGLIKEKEPATVFMIRKNSPGRSPYARKIIQFVKQFNGLPFTTKWLTREFGKGATALGLRELIKSGIVKGYPPLVEVSSGMIAQFEHSMVVTKDGSLVYTRHPDDDW